MTAPEWMNWEGWLWIAPLYGMAVGFYIGFDVRAMRARLDASLEQSKLLRLAFAARAFIAHVNTDEADRRRIELHAAIDAATSEQKAKP